MKFTGFNRTRGLPLASRRVHCECERAALCRGRSLTHLGRQAWLGRVTQAEEGVLDLPVLRFHFFEDFERIAARALAVKCA